MKSNKRIGIFASALLAARFLLSLAADAAEPPFRMVEISGDEFAEVFSRRDEYQVRVDTVESPRMRGIIRNKMLERIDNMGDGAWEYDGFRNSDFSDPIWKFPCGLLAVCVQRPFLECEYWFFAETDGEFVARTGVLPTTNGVEHCVSGEGYMAVWQNHSYDSSADISIYRLQDGAVRLVTCYSDVSISVWKQACFGAGNTFYIGGEYYGDDGEPTAERVVEKYFKFPVSRE
ncbi:MAG: hypothetical protein NC209_04560 [Alistipes sp.]|nr:hypothetical protein [Alistipes senegalensis]MCM1250397.1 hypothetical protein [Alistipes sp.]